MHALADGAGARIEHMNGADLLLLSPGKAAEARADGARVEGEIAFVRRDKARRDPSGGARRRPRHGRGGRVGARELRADGARRRRRRRAARATGESAGEAHAAVITLPGGYGEVVMRVDGTVAQVERDGRTLTLALPPGRHRFSIEKR